MRTAVVSDLHLGTPSGADVARSGPTRERLLEALQGADRVVLLGDTLELRERPMATLLETVRPFFEALAEVTAGRPLTILAGNHDHALAEPWLARLRLDGIALEAEQQWPVGPGDGPAGRLASWMPRTEVTLAYPGLRLRPDVYATHGHYLDVHLTTPRLEAIAAHGMARAVGRADGACRTAADHETVLAPLYAFYGGLAQGASERALRRGGNLSRTVWRRVNGAGGGAAGRLLLGQLAIPGAVALLNRLGLGPLDAHLSGEQLRRSGLAAIVAVAEGMGIEAEHLIFGHSHRAGPLPGDDPCEWRTPSGTRLWNCGNWYHEPALHGGARSDSPYRAGTLLHLDNSGPPRLERVPLPQP